MHQKKGYRRSSWPWVPLEKMKRQNERMRESGSDEKKKEREFFVERKKSYEECEEVRDRKRIKKKKIQLVIVGKKNEKAGTHLMVKLHAV